MPRRGKKISLGLKKNWKKTKKPVEKIHLYRNGKKYTFDCYRDKDIYFNPEFADIIIP